MIHFIFLFLETAEDRDKIADDKLLFQIKWPKFKKAPGMENEIDQESIELKGFKRNGVKVFHSFIAIILTNKFPTQPGDKSDI